MQRPNLQDVLLNNARIDHVPVTIFLVNGVKLQGTVKGFDNFVLMLDVAGMQQIIYKHAISTVIPSALLKMSDDSE